MRSDVNDEFYNVGTGRRMTILELAELLVKITGTSSPIEFEPAGLTFVKNRIGSPDKATEEIGFTASVDLEDGMRNLIAWRDGHKAEVQMRRQRHA